MAQADGKWIKDNTIKQNHVQLDNDNFLRGRNFANTLDISMLKVNTSDLVEFGVQPQFVGSPTVDNDLVNRGYVLGVLAGIRDPKDACRVATVGTNIGLAGSAPNTLDGVALALNDRILVKDQTAGAENGIYFVSTLGTGADGTWTRATDADTDPEVTQGMSTVISEGTLNARKLYVLTTADPITVGVTALVFAQAPNPANFLIPNTAVFTLAAGDITNGYIDLAHQAENASVSVSPIGGPDQEYLVDFTLSVVANVTRVTFAGDLVTRVAAADKLQVSYLYATT